MKRIPQDLNREKALVSSSLSAIDGIDNIIPSVQKKTYNFKGRKSPDIAGPIMLTVTPPGGTIGDPFSGGYSFGIAAGLNGIKYVGNEYDNYTYAVNTVLHTKCDENKLKTMFSTIDSKCRVKIMDLYATSCCGVKNYISKLHFDPEGENGFDEPEYFYPTKHRDIQNNETIILSTPCPRCGAKRKIFEIADLEKIKSTLELDTSKFPKHHLIDNSRINITSAHDADRYDRNFTKRAQFALLTIQEAINELPKSVERDVLEYALVASLTLSRVCQYGSGSEYIYQVMRKQAQEKNVWELFSDKVQSFLNYKKTYKSLQYKDFADRDNLVSLSNMDYREFLIENEGQFDVVFTDPPYTDQVPYFERSQLYRDWLHAFYDENDSFVLTNEMLTKEIVVSNAPSRASTKSGFVQYYKDIDEMFSRTYKSLKADGRLIMIVKLGSNKYIQTLAEFIKLARKNGFEYIGQFGIDKKDPTVRKQAAWKNTMKNEMVVFFSKLDPSDVYWFIGSVNIEAEIVKMLYKKISNKTNFCISLTESISLVQQFMHSDYNLLPNEATQRRIDKTIRDNFLIVDDSYVYIDSNRIYIEEEDEADLFAKLYDTVPLIIKKFDSPDGFTLEDLNYELITRLFDGDSNILEQIIESPSYEADIRNLLENYCTMTDDHKYILKKYTYKKPSVAIDVSSMDGYDFEDLTKRLLLAKGYTDVVRIGGAGDRGVDLIAKKNGEGYIFQCKRWLGNVGGTPIQRLHSMWLQMSPRISHAYCITTSDYTDDGKRESASTKVGIINGRTLMDELEHYFPGEYYHAILDKDKE